MLNQVEFVAAIEAGQVEWSAHALRRMLERDISREAVKYIINHGEVIETYLDDQPFPSGLFHGFWQSNPLHVVAAYDRMAQKVFIISSYRPDSEHFESDFKTRIQT